MSAFNITPAGAYPSIPTIGGDAVSHTNALRALAESVSIHERRTGSVEDSFVRIGDLVGLGIIRESGGTSYFSNAALLDRNPQEFTGESRFTLYTGNAAPAISIRNDNPTLHWYETDADTDDKIWYANVRAEAFQMGVINDANSLNTIWLEVQRTNTTIDSISLNASSVQFVTNAVVGLEITSAQRVLIANAGASTSGGVRIGPGVDNAINSAHLLISGTAIATLALRDSTNDVVTEIHALSGAGVVGTATNHPLVFRTNDGTRLTVQTYNALNLQPIAGDPSSPSDGDIWYNSSTGKFRGRANSTTVDFH